MPPNLAAILTRVAIDVPFDQVPDVVAQTLGVVIDGEMVRRVTEKIGSWAESQEQTRIQDVQSGKCPGVGGTGAQYSLNCLGWGDGEYETHTGWASWAA